MKKIKIFLLVFVFTFIIGGFNLASAFTTSRNLSGLKADYLGSPHYTPDVIGRNGTAKSGITKITYSKQKASLNVKDSRTILVTVANEKGEGMTDTWLSVAGTTNGYATFKGSSSLMEGATADTGIKFAFAAKLAMPWTQAEVSSGTWVIDE